MRSAKILFVTIIITFLVVSLLSENVYAYFFPSPSYRTLKPTYHPPKTIPTYHPPKTIPTYHPPKTIPTYHPPSGYGGSTNYNKYFNIPKYNPPSGYGGSTSYKAPTYSIPKYNVNIALVSAASSSPSSGTSSPSIQSTLKNTQKLLDKLFSGSSSSSSSKIGYNNEFGTVTLNGGERTIKSAGLSSSQEQGYSQRFNQIAEDTYDDIPEVMHTLVDTGALKLEDGKAKVKTRVILKVDTSPSGEEKVESHRYIIPYDQTAVIFGPDTITTKDGDTYKKTMVLSFDDPKLKVGQYYWAYEYIPPEKMASNIWALFVPSSSDNKKTPTASACKSYKDCDDSDKCTMDICFYPKTKKSYCANIPYCNGTNTSCGCIICENCTKPICRGSMKHYNGYCLNGLCYYRSVIDCGNGFCGPYGNNYCCGQNVCHSRACTDTGCNASIGDCYAIPYTDEELVENCTYGCYKGKCISIGNYIKLEPMIANVALGSKNVNISKLIIANKYNHALNLTVKMIARNYPSAIGWIKLDLPTHDCEYIKNCKQFEIDLEKNTTKFVMIKLIKASRTGIYDYDIYVKDKNSGEDYTTKLRLNIFSEAVGSEGIFLLIFLFMVSVGILSYRRL